MRKIKIITLVTLVEKGGAQMAIMRLTQGLRARGHDVQAWAIYHKNQPTDLPFDRVLIPHPPSKWECLQLPGMLTRALKQEKPEGLITFMPLANVVGQCAATLAGVTRRVVSQRNPPWSYRPSMRTLDRLVGATPVYRANVVVSKAVGDDFASYPQAYRNKLQVVYNALIPPAKPIEPRQSVRDRFGVPAQAFLLTATGRLVEQKNHALLLDALARTPEAHLLIAGQGELGPSLQQQARDLGIVGRVHLPGPIPYDDIPSLLAASDAYVMPSIHEGMSNALLEALQAGLPALVSDIPTQVEVIQPDAQAAAGVILPTHDPEPWSQAIVKLMHDEAWRQQLSQAALKRASMFSLDAMIDGFEAALGLRALPAPTALEEP